MANAYEQVDQIAAEALMHLQDALVITQLTTKDKTADFNRTPDGYSVGDSVRIKTRPDYEAKEFTSAIEIQDIRESKRSLTIEKHYDISVELTAKEKVLDLESFSEQVIKPAAYRLAEQCDEYVGTKILEGAGLYVSNSIFGNAADMAQARKESNIQQLNPMGRYCLVNNDLEAQLLGATYFNTYDNRGSSGQVVFNEGNMGRAMGMDFFTSLQLPENTQATVGNGTTQTNNTATTNRIGDTALNIDALTGSIAAGARIKVAGMRRPLKVASAVSASGTSIPLTDPITEIVPDNAAVTVIASGQTNLEFKGAIFDNESIAVAMPMLDPADDKPSSVVTDNGYSIRVVRGYNMNSKKTTLSMDLLIGATAYDPRRITVLREY